MSSEYAKSSRQGHLEVYKNKRKQVRSDFLPQQRSGEGEREHPTAKEDVYGVSKGIGRAIQL